MDAEQPAIPDQKILTRRPRGIVEIPPSKSLSHRAVICGALASAAGRCLIGNPGSSEDLDATLRAVTALGFRWEPAGDKLALTGRPPRPAPTVTLIDCGESASTLRLTLPLAALEGCETHFTGSEGLFRRPLTPYREALAPSGVELRPERNGVRLSGRLQSGVYRLPGDQSSQFVSGLLLALPLLPGDSELRLTTPLESRPYVEMTLEVMAEFGVEVRALPDGYKIPGGQRYRPADYTVEGDYSQAAFFLAAAALGCPVECAGLREHSSQGDREILSILRAMGAQVRRSGNRLTVTADRLRGVTVSARQIPDLIPPLAALCCFCEGESRITDARRLRLKESDRLRALSTQLGALGADIREEGDSLVIHGQPWLRGGAADACGDHRVAMALAVAALRCRTPVRLTGADTIKKSYPSFWEDFEKEEMACGR